MFWCKHSNNAVMLCLYSSSMLIKQLSCNATGYGGVVFEQIYRQIAVSGKRRAG